MNATEIVAKLLETDPDKLDWRSELKRLNWLSVAEQLGYRIDSESYDVPVARKLVVFGDLGNQLTVVVHSDTPENLQEVTFGIYAGKRAGVAEGIMLYYMQMPPLDVIKVLPRIETVLREHRWQAGKSFRYNLLIAMRGVTNDKTLVPMELKWHVVDEI